MEEEARGRAQLRESGTENAASLTAAGTADRSTGAPSQEGEGKAPGCGADPARAPSGPAGAGEGARDHHEDRGHGAHPPPPSAHTEWRRSGKGMGGARGLAHYNLILKPHGPSTRQLAGQPQRVKVTVGKGPPGREPHIRLLRQGARSQPSLSGPSSEHVSGLRSREARGQGQGDPGLTHSG